jgi:hypothetical protein
VVAILSILSLIDSTSGMHKHESGGAHTKDSDRTIAPDRFDAVQSRIPSRI